MKLITLLLLLSFLSICSAEDTTEYEKLCADIGYKKKTEGFGNCVIEFVARSKQAEKSQSSNTDGSAEDIQCQRFGFKPNTKEYSNCRMSLELSNRQSAQAMQENRELQIQLQRQTEAYQRAHADESSRRWLQLSQDLLKPNTVAPMHTDTNHTIRLPNGRQVHCDTFGTNTNCY
jgi:hypothetical protein